MNATMQATIYISASLLIDNRVVQSESSCLITYTSSCDIRSEISVRNRAIVYCWFCN